MTGWAFETCTVIELASFTCSCPPPSEGFSGLGASYSICQSGVLVFGESVCDSHAAFDVDGYVCPLLNGKQSVFLTCTAFSYIRTVS